MYLWNLLLCFSLNFSTDPLALSCGPPGKPPHATFERVNLRFFFFFCKDFHSTLVLNKKSLFPRRKQHIKVCPFIHFALLYSWFTSCLCSDVTAAQGTRGPKRGGKKKKQVVEAFVETGSKEGESRAEVVVVTKKNFGRERSVFYYPVILSSLDQQCSRACGWLEREDFPSVAWTPLSEGRSRASRRSGRSNGYLIRSLVLFALPDRPPHWNEPHITVSLLL